MPANQACILILGQSNVANHGPDRENGGANARVFHYGSFLPAVDPLPGASGGGGSVWTRFAPKLVDSKMYSEVILVPVAHGDTSIADWIPGGYNHSNIVSVLNEAAKAGINFTHVIWHQGERDTLMATSQEKYREALDRLVAYLRETGIDTPFIVCQASYRFGKTSSGIRAAQQDIVNPAAGIFAGPDTDTLGAEYRHDDTHLDSSGQDIFADMMLEAFAGIEPGQKSVSSG